MLAILRYIRDVSRERSTRILFPVFLLCLLALALWRAYPAIITAGVLSGFGAAVKDRVFEVAWAFLCRLALVAIHIVIRLLPTRAAKVAPVIVKEIVPMSVFEKIKADIAAAEALAEKDAAAVIAAAKTQAGQAVIKAAVAELPIEDQPLANAILSVAGDPSPSNIATALEDAYSLLTAAKNAPAPMPPGSIEATIQPTI